MSEGVQDKFPELWATQPVKGVPGPGSACGGAQRWDRQAVRQPGAGGGAGGRAPCTVPADELPASPRAQVPVIPVVYSSLSSFYDARTKLFTSGSARTASMHGLPVSLPGTPGPVSAGRGAPQGAGGRGWSQPQACSQGGTQAPRGRVGPRVRTHGPGCAHGLGLEAGASCAEGGLPSQCV